MYPDSFQKLINQFSSLPGVGPKMAERLVLFLFKQDKKTIDSFSQDLNELKNISSCKKCFNIAQDDLCSICANSSRDHKKICIVEEALDIIPIERSRAFDGVYHVLGGTVKKQNENNLTVNDLLNRLDADKFDEIIIATNFTTEGDMTAMYLKQKISKYKIPISRLVRGLATGSDIEYADDITLRSSLTNRQKF